MAPRNRTMTDSTDSDGVSMRSRIGEELYRRSMLYRRLDMWVRARGSIPIRPIDQLLVKQIRCHHPRGTYHGVWRCSVCGAEDIEKPRLATVVGNKITFSTDNPSESAAAVAEDVLAKLRDIEDGVKESSEDATERKAWREWALRYCAASEWETCTDEEIRKSLHALDLSTSDTKDTRLESWRQWAIRGLGLKPGQAMRSTDDDLRMWLATQMHVAQARAGDIAHLAEWVKWGNDIRGAHENDTGDDHRARIDKFIAHIQGELQKNAAEAKAWAWTASLYEPRKVGDSPSDHRARLVRFIDNLRNAAALIAKLVHGCGLEWKTNAEVVASVQTIIEENLEMRIGRKRVNRKKRKRLALSVAKSLRVCTTGWRRDEANELIELLTEED